MPITPPRRPNPKDPAFKHTVDRRIHPIQDMSYRVLDPNWTTLWGHNLPWDEAKKLKTKVANKRLSSTVMIEAEDVPIPESMRAAAQAAAEALHAHVASAVGPQVPPPQVIASPSPAVHLASIQSAALGVAGATAREANERAEAAARREKYKLEREQSQRETDELAKKAGELAGGDDVGDAELADFLDGTTAMPTDAEIKKAKDAAK